MKLLIVDDSPLARAIIGDLLKKLDFITQIDTARNGKAALDMLQNNSYDLIILDVEMPIMNGLKFLEEKKNIHDTTPTIMLSSLTKEGSEITLKALELGAIDFIPKPTGNKYSFDEIQEELHHKIRNVYNDFILRKKDTNKKSEYISYSPKHQTSKKLSEFEIVLFGSSTGGPKTLVNILKDIPKDFPLPIAIVQHMPEFFTFTLASRLNQIAKLKVFEAEQDQILKPGTIVVAKGNKHLLFERLQDKTFKILLDDSPKIHAVRPSIDKTLENLVNITKGRTIAVILSGMGKDGIESLKLLKKHSGFVIAQDEETSTIFGMNKRAIEENVVDVVLPDYKIADYLTKMNEF